MPFGDGTGPAGLGPRTGRGLGYCNGYSTPGYTKPWGRGFYGRGWGRGLGYGWGRGRGWGRGYWGYRAPVYPGPVVPVYNPVINEETYLKDLEAQKKYLEDEMKALEEEIKNLKEKKKSE